MQELFRTLWSPYLSFPSLFNLYIPSLASSDSESPFGLNLWAILLKFLFPDLFFYSIGSGTYERNVLFCEKQADWASGRFNMFSR